MKEVESLFKKAVDELENLLNTRSVVGEPITVGEATIIPLVSIGFAFGVGGGTGRGPQQAEGEGTGGGTGGGGGVKPVAIVVVDGEGVRLETIRRRRGRVLEKAVDTFGKVATDAVRQRKEAEAGDGSAGDESAGDES